MKTIMVDDELWMMRQFEEESGAIADIELIGKFRDPLSALDFARSHRIDLAFLDIEMPKMTGLELSDKLRELYPEVIIIFVSAYDEYMSEAFRRRAADYFVLKPYTREDVEAVLQRAKLLSARLKKRIYIETFGHFCLYVDGAPVKFTSMDAKQLLALLVDRRGTALGNQDAFNLMWEDRLYDHSSAVSLHKALRKLKDTLQRAGCGDLIIPVPPSAHRLNRELVDCDLYQFLDGEPEARRRFCGEYMTEWPWSEETVGLLTQLKG